MKIRIFILGFTILFISLWAIYLNYLKEDGEFIHVAFAGPTGEKAGEFMTQAIQLYLDDVNKKGGINGKKIKLDLYNDENECSRKAPEEATKIVNDDKAVAVIGHWYSGCSISAGQVYKKYGIPAITPGSVSVEVTQDNEWYFRNIYNVKASASFLANYVKKVFRQDKVSIIREDGAYGAYLADIFAKSALDLGMEVKNVWDYQVADKELPKTFKKIINELKEKQEEAGVILLAVQAHEGVQLVKLIKDNNIQNTIIGESSLSEEAFQEGFKEFPKEKANPGFYTNDIYVATPLIFDTANEKAQRFKSAFEKKYHQEPDWSAAYAYDTAMVLVKAIKETGISGGNAGDLAAERRKIRDYLAKMTNVHDAIEGATGFNYFNANRDAQKPVSIGIYKLNSLVSALTQFQVMRNLNELSDPEQALKEERILKIGDNYMYKTNVVYVGIKINEINEIEKDFTYIMDFHIWFRFQGGFQPQNIEFLNMAEPVELNSPPDVDKITDNITYRVFRVKGKFKADFLNDFVYKQHTLGVTFRHKELTRNNLIYVTDILGMGLTEGKSLGKQMTENQVLNPATGWIIEGEPRFFQDIEKKYSLGDPEYLHVRGGTVEYSRFNAGIQIKKSEFSLRGMLSYKHARNLLMLSVVVILVLNIVSATKRFHYSLKLIWVFQTIFAFMLLLSGEVILVGWLAENVNTYNLTTIIRIFDILWWLIPAFLINKASESFIWTPIEEKTGRPIPNIVRLFLAFLIYFLACVGIIAFVYEQQLTSILATSGVIAMIIGLAIQINISNIFSGIAINLERPFRIGDWVQIGQFEEGEIVDITWRTTRLKSRADCILSIPNSIASESPILNFCYPDESYWLWPTVYVHPMHHPERVRKILLDALLSVQSILKDPEPVVIFTGINEWASSYWIAFCADNYERKNYILEDVWTRVWFHLNRAGITPAVQRQEIHVFRGVKERGGEEATRPITLLREVDIFRPFPEDAKMYLSQRMRRHRLPLGEVIVKQGDPGDSLFIIVEGVVGVSVESEEGIMTEVARLGAGNFFGEMALLTGEDRTATVISIAETVLYEITKADIAPLIAEQPEVSELVSKVLTQRQLATRSKLHIQQDSGIEKEDVYMRVLNKIQNFFGLGNDAE